MQGVPLDLGEYKLLNFKAICQRVTQPNLNIRVFCMVPGGCLIDDSITRVVLHS